MMATEQNNQFPGELRYQSYPRKKVILDESQMAWFSRFYPITETRVVAEMTGIPQTTIKRIAKRNGLKKSPEGLAAIKRRRDLAAADTNRKNGLFEKLKERHATGWNPMRKAKEDPERYSEMISRRVATRRARVENDKLRMMAGLKRNTRYHLPTVPYNRAQTDYRYRFLRNGYILGDPREELCERYTIYWDDDTRRLPRIEESARKKGFTFQMLKD